MKVLRASMTLCKIQSDAWCNYQPKQSFCKTHLLLVFTKFIDDLAEIGTASFIFKMKVLRASMTLCKIQSDAWCNYQPKQSFCKTHLLLVFTKFIDDLAEIGTASFIFKIKVLRASVTLCKIQSDAWCKYQPEQSFCKAHFLLFFTKFRDDLAEIGIASFTFKMKVLKASVTLCKTVSCLNVYLFCCSNTSEAPKIRALVHL